MKASVFHKKMDAISRLFEEMKTSEIPIRPVPLLQLIQKAQSEEELNEAVRKFEESGLKKNFRFFTAIIQVCFSSVFLTFQRHVLI